MKTIFWNVDTQYDFMKSDGKLYVKDAENIEKNLEKLTKFAEKNEIKVINTADWHNLDSGELSDSPDYMNSFPPHCMKGTSGAKYISETNPANPYKISWEQKDFDKEKVLKKRNIVLYKDKFDVFTGTPHAERVLEIIKPDRAIIYGVATNVCVDCAVRGLLERKIEVYVPLDAIKELPGLPLPYESWKGAKFVTTKDVLEGRI
jgi:nicotinamidase/pyrazinamidase